MDLFEQHIKNHLSGKHKTKPEWIKKAIRNRAARIRYAMKVHGLSKEEAIDRVDAEREDPNEPYE